MKQARANKLEVIRGRLTDLCIQSDEISFLHNNPHIVAGGVAAGLAVAGLAGSATGALLASAAAHDSVQVFSGVIAGEHVTGCVSEVSFQNGDDIECAVDKQSDGTLVAYAVRRPSDHTIWMFPHCSRGRVKHWRYAAKMFGILSFVISIFLLAWLVPDVGFAMWKNERAYLPATIFITIGIVMGAYFSLNTARRWMPFVTTAEAIFEAYGYRNPRDVDLVADDKSYWKQHSARGEIRACAPWVFKYVYH